MKTVLIVCPSGWDRYQLPRSRPRWEDRYRPVPHGQDDDADPSTFDPDRFVPETIERFRDRVDGVASSSDYPGSIVAAVIAKEMGLPGPDPDAIIRCSHKYYSRGVQHTVVPEATPPFELVDPARLTRHSFRLEFPAFVKPVKSWFSYLAQRVETFEELEAYAARADVRAHLEKFVAPFNALLRSHTRLELDGSYLLAERLLSGQQVTVEGFVAADGVHILGIVDSVMYPGTISFQRFEYPSALPEPVQERMRDVATRVVAAMGLRYSLFNVEMFYEPATNEVAVIEINPRMCGQFADLYELVDGTNTYEILFALATGERPAVRVGAGRYPVAASFPLRSFRDRRVVRVPDEESIAALQRDNPVSLVKSPYHAGQRLSDVDTTDGSSYRYAVVNMAGHDRKSLQEMFLEVERRLGFEFADPA